MMLRPNMFAQGELPYKSDEDARRKVQTRRLRKTNVGLAQA